jgi:hypothetical protein
MKNKHTFIISIDDGDCRYEYPLTVKNGKDVSIHDIYKTLCKAYKVEPVEGVLEGVYLPGKIWKSREN